MALASVLAVLTASFVLLALWDNSDYLLLGVLVSDADIDVSSSEVVAAESFVHLHLYDSQAIFSYVCVCCFDIFFPFRPLALLLCSNSVFQWPKYGPSQAKEDFFPVLRVGTSCGAYGIVNLKPLTFILSPSLHSSSMKLLSLPPPYCPFPCALPLPTIHHWESQCLWKCDCL